MLTYTTLLQSPYDQISPEDDNFIEELLGVAQLFRPFSEGWMNLLWLMPMLAIWVTLVEHDDVNVHDDIYILCSTAASVTS